MPRLSIVIPVLGDTDLLESGLVSVLQHRPPDCEVIVALAVAYDDPYELTDEVRFVEARRGAGLAETFNAALAEVRAPIIHLLQSGAEVHEGWTDAPLAHFVHPTVGAVAPLVVPLDRPGRLQSAGVDYRRSGRRVERARGRRLQAAPPRGEPLGPSTAAGFYRAAALAAIGAVADRSAGELLFDVELALRLRDANYSCQLEPECQVAVPRKALPRTTGFGVGRGAERLFWRRRQLDRRPWSLLAHAGHVVFETVAHPLTLGTWTGLLGRCLGAIEESIRGTPDFRADAIPLRPTTAGPSSSRSARPARRRSRTSTTSPVAGPHVLPAQDTAPARRSKAA